MVNNFPCSVWPLPFAHHLSIGLWGYDNLLKYSLSDLFKALIFYFVEFDMMSQKLFIVFSNFTSCILIALSKANCFILLF